MRTKVFSVLLILFVAPLLWHGSYPAGAEASAVPGIYLPEAHFEFPPVFDGQEVRHDFVVWNKGTSPLDIRDVKTDCGCTTVSYPRRIGAGNEGRIVIKLDTSGYGGQHVTKTISVRTNDKSQGKFDLVITGTVKPYADINPTEAKLTGNVGQKIKQTVIIAPMGENRFKILEVKAEKGDNIRFDLIEMNQEDGMKYKLTIYNMKQDKGWYIDNIYLKTSSKISPVIKIRVLGFIRSKS
jgi:Protein of unknown function (DUF1573)